MPKMEDKKEKGKNPVRIVLLLGVLLCYKEGKLGCLQEKWMYFETIISSEIKQTEKLKYYVVSLI